MPFPPSADASLLPWVNNRVAFGLTFLRNPGHVVQRFSSIFWQPIDDAAQSIRLRYRTLTEVTIFGHTCPVGGHLRADWTATARLITDDIETAGGVEHVRCSVIRAHPGCVP